MTSEKSQEDKVLADTRALKKGKSSSLSTTSFDTSKQRPRDVNWWELLPLLNLEIRPLSKEKGLQVKGKAQKLSLTSLFQNEALPPLDLLHFMVDMPGASLKANSVGEKSNIWQGLREAKYVHIKSFNVHHSALKARLTGRVRIVAYQWLEGAVDVYGKGALRYIDELSTLKLIHPGVGSLVKIILVGMSAAQNESDAPDDEKEIHFTIRFQDQKVWINDLPIMQQTPLNL